MSNITSNLGVVARAILSLQQRLGRAESTVQALARFGTEQTRLGFLTQSDPWGNPWQPLAPFTLAARRGGGRGAQILRDTGALMNSVTARVSGTQITIGSPLIYAGVHQHGATIRPRRGDRLLIGRPGGPRASVKQVTIPARPWLPIRNGRVDLPVSWIRGFDSVVYRRMLGGAPFRPVTGAA